MKLGDIVYHLASREAKPNKVMKSKVLPFLLENNVKKALDYGCGKYLRDSLLLAESGIRVDAVDVPEQVERIGKDIASRVHSVSACIPSSGYDAALLNYVIQVIPLQEKRMAVMADVYDSIRKGGYLVLSLRTEADIERCVKPGYIPFNDGYVSPNTHTFVRPYSKEEAESLLASFGWGIAKLFHKKSMHFIAIAQK